MRKLFLAIIPMLILILAGVLIMGRAGVWSMFGYSAKAAITDGLVGYWNFDEGTGTTASDSSGSGNTGTLTNGPTWITGKISQALSFDGVNDYVDVGSPVALNLPGEMSAFTWIKVGVNQTAGIIVQDRSCCDDQYNFYYNSTNGKIALKWGDAAETISGAVLANPINTWHHVGFTRLGSSGNWTSNIYIDGVLVSTKTGIITNPGTQSAAHIGLSLWQSPDAYFNGLIDDVRIYNRALSASEIQRLYNMGR